MITPARERRREPRIPVTMDALVHFRSGRSWVCTICDFCPAGMFVQGDVAGLRNAIGDLEPEADSLPLEVHFTVQGKAGPEHHHLTGVAVRRLDHGLGVHFPKGISARSFTALVSQAELRQRGTQGVSPDNTTHGTHLSIDPEKGRKIAQACAKLVEASLSRFIGELLHLYEDELAACERRASSMAEREAYSHAIRILPRSEKRIAADFVGFVVTLLRERQSPSLAGLADPATVENEAPATPAAPPAKGVRLFGKTQLSLVDKGDFEQWLVVAETVSAVENKLQEDTFVLRTWFGLIEPSWKNKDSNPICPSVIGRSLKQALMPLSLKEEAIRVAFSCFGRIALSRLEKLYDRLISSLEKTQLFPSIEAIITEQVRQPASARVVEFDRRGGHPQEPAGGVGTGSVDHSRPSPASAGRLLDIAMQAAAGREQAPRQPQVDPDSVIRSLSALQDQRALTDEVDNRALKKVLLEQLAAAAGREVHLPAETERAIDMVDYLVDSVQEDEALSASIRKLIGKLEPTLGREAVRNEALLNGEPEQQPALQILNQLEDVDSAEIANDTGLNATGEQVASILARLMNEWEDRPSAFEEAVEQLKPLVDRQRKVYERNVDRIVSGCEGRSRLRRARQAVLRRLVELLEGRRVPPGFMEIINPSWRNLLVNTALRQGIRSVEWKQQLQVIQWIIARFDPETRAKYARAAEDGSGEVILRCIVEGLESVGGKPPAQAMEHLRQAIFGQLPADQCLLVEPGSLAPLFGWQDVARPQEPMPPVEDEQARRQWLECLRRARVMETGTNVKFTGEDGKERVCTLAWVDGQAEQFVFVNRRGLWDREVALGELTDGLVGGTAKILDGYEAPLLERVIERMLRRVHKRIANDAQADELTGLANRKAFERSLQLLLDSSRESDASHCVLQIDLDRFRMVNMACGFDGGDQALKRVARIIEETMNELDVTIARIGADEFGVVLFDTDVPAGEELANRILSSIREMDFVWKQQSSTITATIGVVRVDRTTESVHLMLQNLAGACRAGKETGGDRSFIYTEDDGALAEQRAVMQLASQVEQWLAEGRVRLNVQKIEPADSTASLLPHFEVLITVGDEQGTPGSPVKFIEAAERYSKMPLVDRFVITGVFEWMAAHPEALEGLSGLAINLSGQSIIQEDFLSFVLDQFERTGAPPGKVCFELTETAAVGNLFRATEFMLKLKVMGCRFSLDDFGAGMSSYGYLRRLPVDYLKIDGSFVRNMVTEESDQAVVRSINEIGHFLGKKTVAEYVHDERTAELARAIGIDLLQGWGVEKPKPIDQLLLPSTAAVSA